MSLMQRTARRLAAIAGMAATLAFAAGAAPEGDAAGPLYKIGAPPLNVDGEAVRVAFSADGKFFAVATRRSGAASGSLLAVFDVALGRRVAATRIPDSTPADLYFSRDGSELYTGQTVWKHRTGQLEPPRRAGVVRAASHDRRFLLLADREGKGESIVDIELGKTTRRIELPAGGDGVTAAAFSTDGKLIARAVAKGRFLVLDAEKGELLHDVAIPEGPYVASLAFSHDGKKLAAGFMSGPVEAAVYRVDSGRRAAACSSGSAGAVRSISWAPDDETLVAVRGDGAIRVWNAETGTLEKEVEGRNRPLAAAALSPDGRWLAAAGTGPVCALHVLDATDWSERSYGASGGPPIFRLTYAPQGHAIASAANSREVRQWDVATRRSTMALEADATHALAYSADGWLLAAAGRNAGYTLWESASGDELASQVRAAEPSRDAVHVAFTRDLDRLISADDRGAIDVVQSSNAKRVVQFAPYAGDACSAMAVSPDGQTIATTPSARHAAGRSIVVDLWNVRDGSPQATLESTQMRTAAEGRDPAFERLEFSPDGTMLAAHGRNRFELWDVTARQSVHRSTPYGFTFAFSPDGKLIVLLSPRGFAVVELATGRVAWRVAEEHFQAGDVQWKRSVGEPSPEFSALAVSPDGQYVATATRNNEPIWVWSLRPPSMPAEFDPKDLDIDREWDRLEEVDPAGALAAVWKLAAGGDDVAREIGRRIAPAAERVDPVAAIRQLIAQLDADAFADRQQAMKGLEAFGAVAEPLLKTALADPPSPEAKRRIEMVLRAVQGRVVRISGKPLQPIRAIGVLERIGSPAAREVLDKLSRGSATARETIEAKAALIRLEAKRRGP